MASLETSELELKELAVFWDPADSEVAGDPGGETLVWRIPVPTWDPPESGKHTPPYGKLRYNTVHVTVSQMIGYGISLSLTYKQITRNCAFLCDDHYL